jgi:hypothetical protein
LKRHEVIFNGMFKGSTLKVEFVSLRFIQPGVAIVELVTEVAGTGISRSVPVQTPADGRRSTQ